MQLTSTVTNVQPDDSLVWEPDSLERIMILAPHPDDETLAAGGVIASAGNPSNVRVIVATNGDASYTSVFLHGSRFATRKNFQRQARLRQQESLRAIALLGLNAEQIHFWGFPDRGLAALWKNHRDSQGAYHSPTTGYDKSFQALNSPILPFTRASLEELFAKELLEFHPTTIIMPHPRDNHADHRALAGFALNAVKQFCARTHLPSPNLFAYWMWRAAKPWRREAPPREVAQFPVGANPSRRDDRFFILRPEIHEKKAHALQCYPSQKIAAGRLFRAAVARQHEAFTVLHIAL